MTITTGQDDANKPQTFRDDGAGRYFHFMLNMADDDLDPFQYRLLGHYRRTCGAYNKPCGETTRETADKCRMSLGQTSQTRQWLADQHWITVEHRKNRIIVTLVDRMPENVARYDRSPHEQPGEARSPGEPPSGERSPGEQNTPPAPAAADSVHQVNKSFTPRTDRSPGESSLYIESTTESTSLESTTTGGAPDPCELPTPARADVVDADLELIKPEIQKLCLLPQNQAALLAKGPAYALAVAWAAQGPRIGNPGGFALSMMAKDGPPERLLAAAAVALELGSINRQEAETQLRRREYAQLQAEARAVAQDETDPPAPEQEPDQPPPQESPAPLPENDGLDYQPGGKSLTMREIWHLEMGQLGLQLNRPTYTNWVEGAKAVSYADGVLTVRARTIMARAMLEKMNAATEQAVSRLAHEEIKVQYVVEGPEFVRQTP